MAQAPKELVLAVGKAFAALGKNSVVGDVDKYVAAFVGAAPYIQVDTRPLDQRSNPFVSKVLTPYLAWKVASLVPWLFVRLPVGDRVRAGIPKVVDALRRVLLDKRNVWVLDGKYFDEESPSKRRARHVAMASFVGGAPITPSKKKGTWLDGRDDGTLILAPCAPEATTEDATVYGAIYTAKLDDRSRLRMKEYALGLSGWDEAALDVIPTAERLLSNGFAALGARVAKTPVAVGSYEANPAASAPELIAKVVAAHRVSSDAAALYLQTIALPEPTTADVLRWNGWDAKRHAAAATELVRAKLVVQRKVDGAGRNHFAPGDIVKKTKLNRPLERSKLAFVQHGRSIKHLIAEPCHMLFERAYTST
jgi:hypothetical protein